jgi:hypothetical protein
MAVTRIGQATASATSISIPAHQAGDLILITARSYGLTGAVVKPSSFTLIQEGVLAALNSFTSGYIIATHSSHTSSTWTNANRITVTVYRPSAGRTIDIGSSSKIIKSTSSTTLTYPGITLANNNGRSLIFRGAMSGNESSTANGMATAPTGYTNYQQIGSNPSLVSHELAGGTSTNPVSQNVTLSSSTENISITAEIQESDILPTATTGTASGNTIDSITVSGSSIANPDSFTISEYGVAYATTTTPTISDNKQVGTGTESDFDAALSSLSEDTTYYMRAYATWDGNTTYGSEITRKTQGRPLVSLNTPSNAGTSSIIRPQLRFTGTDADNDNITYQVQVNTTSDFTTPLIDRLSASDSGFANLSTSKTDPFFSGNQIGYTLQQDLTRGQEYHWRVRGKDTTGANEFGEWSSTFSFTVDPVVASLTTNGASNILETTADVQATIDSNGGATITERGVVYATTTNPTVADTKVTVAGTTSPYTANLTGLTGATTYYARAYAINSVGTSYGNNITFATTTPASPPTVVTGSAAFTTDTSSEFNGNEVTSGHGFTVAERGIVFSDTETTPTTEDRVVTATTGGVGTYNLTMTGLEAETTYYVRAYAISSEGTGYGDVETFVTSAPYASDEGDGYWAWSPGNSQATVGRTQPTPASSSVNLPLADLGLTNGLQYTFYYGGVDANEGTPSVVIERTDGETLVENTITAGTAYTFTYDTALTNWHIKLYVTDLAESEEITAVFNDMYLAQESTFSGYVPFTPRGVTEVKIINNQIVDKRRDEVISSMFDQVSGVEWYPFEIATEGLGYFEVGDRFTIEDHNEVQHSVVVWNTKLTLDGGIKEVLYTNKPDITETNYSKAGNSRLRGNIRNTTLQVDKQAGTIEALVSDMYDLDGVVNTIYSELQQDNQSITATVQGAGGSNLVQNSVMYAFDVEGNPDSWTLDDSSVGTLTIQASNESLSQGAVSGNQFNLSDMTVTQRVTVRKDVDFIDEDDKLYYSISARVKKNTVGTAWIKLINRNEELTIDLPDQTSYFWDIVKIEGILPKDDYFDVEIYSDSDADLQVTDLMLSPGITRKQWTQANGEMMNSSVAITTEGITVRSSAFTNNYTKIDALGFEVHKQSAEGARVFGFNDDETNVSKLKADEQITMAPLRVVPINYGTYQGWAWTISEDN